MKDYPSAILIIKVSNDTIVEMKDGLPKNTIELLRFVAKADKLTFIRRPKSGKDPMVFASRIGIGPYTVEDMIKSLKEEECRSKFEGDPCDDDRVECEKMWCFIHLYTPYEGEPHSIYIKIAPEIARRPDGKEEIKIVVVLSFHEEESLWIKRE